MTPGSADAAPAGESASDEPASSGQFEAVDRGERGVGVRDRVLVLPSVICSREVADRIAEAPGAVSAPHDHGCAQIGDDRDQTYRTFLGVGSNPNVAGTVVVGLGCESVGSGEVAEGLADCGVPVREVGIQDAGGTGACIEAGRGAVDALRGAGGTGAGEGETGDGGRENGDGGETAAATAADLSDLTVGVASSDLTRSTRETADPLVGGFVDRLVAAGGRAVVAGNERVTAHLEAARAAAGSESTAPAVDDLVERHRGQPSRASRVGREAADRDFETVTRAWGDRPVREVLAYGERTTLDSGVALVDAPSRFEEAATALAAAGAQVVVHVTGEGIPTGHPVVPVLKVSADPATLAAVGDDVDVDARDASVADLRGRVLAVAGGQRTRAEAHGLASMAITRVGPSM